MTEARGIARQFAFALAHHAARRLPTSRATWAEPMRHEVESIENDLAAVQWAAGCVVASYAEGVKTMSTSSFSALIGVVGFVVLAFGGYVLSGGNLAVVVEALPHELITILGGALATTYILTSAGGPGSLRSIALAFKGRQFRWGEYRALASILSRELNAKSDLVKTRSLPILAEGDGGQMIRDAKAMLEQQIGADQIGFMLQARIDALLTCQRRGVNVLQMLGRTLLWFGALAFLLSEVKVFGQFSEPLEVIGGMMGSAVTGLVDGLILGVGLIFPLANRLDAVITMDANFYAFIRTAFVCRAAGSDAATAIRTANGALTADLALDDGELIALPNLAAEGRA